jgi:hypothetical protein
MGDGSERETADLWWARAEQARRVAATLRGADARSIEAYAEECEAKARLLPQARRIKRSAA